MGGGDLRAAVLSLFLVSILIIPFSEKSQAWDSIKNQFLPDDMLDRPPEVYTGYDFDNVFFNREYFNTIVEGMKQHRRYKTAPKKSMEFEVLHPLDAEPKTKAVIIEKDGKAVTVISIEKDPEDENK